MGYLGIDLGTTNSVACTLKNGKFEYIRFHGSDLLSSAILYKDGKITVGTAAKRKSILYADHYIASSKTYMGDMSKQWNIDDRIFTPTDVATEVLKTIHKEAERFFGDGEKIEAVITTPAYFSGNQNDETKKAGEAAGFVVKQILAEPVSAALAYAFGDRHSREKIYVVDLGGGTFDVSLLEMNGDNTFTTLMKGGDRKLGGDNFDEALLEIMYRSIRKTIGVNFSSFESSGLKSEADYNKARQKLLQEAEKVKCALSESESEDVTLVNLFPHKEGYYDFNMTITRQDFMDEASTLIRKIENTIKNSFDEIEYDREDVDRIVLVGGSANMPFVRDFVEQFFGKRPYADKDLSKLVAMGAALLANDESNTITLHDIIAHSLGIEVIGERMEKILMRNEQYPCQRSKMFTTTYDYQESVDINVFEGEDSENLDGDSYYGGFTLNNIERARQGCPQIEVTFSYDASCILHVSAKDLSTGSRNSQDIKIDKTSVRTKPETHETQQPYDIALLLDSSGSMWGDSIVAAKEACKLLVREMVDTATHRISFISFGSYVNIHYNLTHDKQQLLRSIESVSVSGSTNMRDAFSEAYNVLDGSGNTPLVIIVTDGMPDNQYEASMQAHRLKNDGIKIIAIGAGSVNHTYLKSLASSEADYYAIRDMQGLTEAFKTIATGLRLY